MGRNRHRVLSPVLSAATTLLLGASLIVTTSAPASATGHRLLVVPGAERQVVSTLADLTTTGTAASGHTDPADYAGLHAPGTVTPSGVPGIQIDGYFPDTSVSNTNHGWQHDSQFVIRLPDRWNGGLVVTGAPGVREQYANDVIISDAVLAKGYAFASTDKGNTGAGFHLDGVRPGDAILEWHLRVTQLTVAAKAVAAQRYGRLPARTIMTGLSNGGYLTRWQLENVPWLYDGGVDWSGTLFTPDGPHLLTFLPPALRAYPRYAAGDPTAAAEMYAAGFAPGSEPTWDFHHTVYWPITQSIYRQELDPMYTGPEADYDYATRPASVRAAVRRISLTGRLGRPLITLHGTLDALLPIAVDSDVYAGMVRDRKSFRYYRVTGGLHVEGIVPNYPGVARPMLPCYLAAFDAMERWVAGRGTPPPSRTLPFHPTACGLAG